jgi:dTDP-4-amino-4,6-dideoxygalactose transaminase
MSQAPVALGKIYKTDGQMAIRRMAILPTMIEAQRRNADWYLRNLTVDNGMLCLETPGAFFNRLQFPLLVPNPAQCDRLAERLRQNHISTGRPYKDIVTIAGRYGYRGDCPQGERIASTILVIPCNYGLNKKDVERISTCVNHAWAEASGCGTGIGSIPDCAMTPLSSENITSVAERHHFS